jgi:hypothetical protein
MNEPLATIPPRARFHFWIVLTAIVLSAWSGRAAAQELEPGLYQNAPLRMNSAVVGYTYSSGNILFDASLPVEGSHAKTHTVALGYLRTIGIFGRSAKVDVQVPVASGDFQGTVAGVFRTRSPSGLADPRIRLSVNLFGAPALERKDFASYQPKTIVGAGAQVVVPVGQYDPERLINLGANRWAFRAEAGVSHTRKGWFLDAVGGSWFFTQNTDYYGGSTVSQQPLPFVKGDVLYTFRRGLWSALSYGLASGGKTSINGAPATNLQTNNRLAATLAYPIARATSLQLKYTSGLSTRLGADFDSYGAVIQYTWGS